MVAGNVWFYLGDDGVELILRGILNRIDRTKSNVVLFLLRHCDITYTALFLPLPSNIRVIDRILLLPAKVAIV
jgi:hypothetical protein